MRDRIRPVLQRLATRRVVVLTGLAALVCVTAFQWRDARLGGLDLLDVRQWYTPDQAAALFGALDRLDPRARAVYAWTEVTVDLVSRWRTACSLLSRCSASSQTDDPYTCCRSPGP